MDQIKNRVLRRARRMWLVETATEKEDQVEVELTALLLKAGPDVVLVRAAKKIHVVEQHRDGLAAPRRALRLAPVTRGRGEVR
jgi:hypothetical protein